MTTTIREFLQAVATGTACARSRWTQGAPIEAAERAALDAARKRAAITPHCAEAFSHSALARRRAKSLRNVRSKPEAPVEFRGELESSSNNASGRAVLRGAAATCSFGTDSA